MTVKISSKITDKLGEESLRKTILAYTVIAPIIVIELKKIGLEKESFEAEANINAALNSKSIDRLRKEISRWSKVIENNKNRC